VEGELGASTVSQDGTELPGFCVVGIQTGEEFDRHATSWA
jgi:hypothetical protein